MGRNDKVELTLHLHHETEKAILVSDDGDEKHAVWLPKSQVTWEDQNGGILVECPEWLAMAKELI